MNKSPIKTFLMVGGILILLSLTYVILVNVTKNNAKDEEIYLKNYKVNEYIPSYVSEEDMAKIYLKDYVHNMYYDIDKAYDSLDTEYRNKKFGSIEQYKTYVYNLEHTAFVVSRYYVQTKDEYIIFGVYDTFGNLYIFKTNGVMQYSVYLDDYTVEI